jgi:hypothetical protein
MSNPNHPVGTQVDPSEDTIDEGAEQQSFQASEAEGEGSAVLEVDPSEGPAE